MKVSRGFVTTVSRFGLAVALIGAASLVAAAPALADTLVSTDPAGDVVAASTQTVTPSTTPAPTHANGDVVGTRLTNGSRAVRVKVRFRQLTRVGSFQLVVVIRSNVDKRYVEVTARPGHYQGRVRMTTEDPDQLVRCDLSFSLDYVGNVAMVVVPRVCLGRPRWVRVGVGAVTTTDGYRTVFADDARTNGIVREADPVLSPRIWQ